MENPTGYEVQAMVDAGESGKNYLMELGNFDLATMEYNDFMRFVDAVCTGYCDSMRKQGAFLASGDQVPF